VRDEQVVSDGAIIRTDNARDHDSEARKDYAARSRVGELGVLVGKGVYVGRKESLYLPLNESIFGASAVMAVESIAT